MTPIDSKSHPGGPTDSRFDRNRLAAYPPQEPLSALGEAYGNQALLLGADVQGEEIRYGHDPHQSLAIFRAAEPNGSVLLFFHGGGWTNGYKEWMYFMAPALNAHGVTFVSATYRLAPRHVFPAGFEDCADAVKWTYRTLMPSMGPTPALFVGGHSAGGHYAALLAVSGQWRAERALPLEVLEGCVPVCGVYRFGENSGLAVRPRFLGMDPASEQKASPILNISAPLIPPFFLSHGSRDFPHLIAQAGEMARALRAASVPLQVEVIEDCNHFEANLAAADPAHPWVVKLAKWMHHIRCKTDV